MYKIVPKKKKERKKIPPKMLQVCLKHEFNYTQCCLFFGNRGEREALAQSIGNRTDDKRVVVSPEEIK